MPAIDFITLSRDPQRVRLLEQSIAISMGSIFAHKLTVMDGNRYDLFTGYNAGAAQTSAEILAFVHDDVQLLGSALAFGAPVQLMQDPSTGFVGAFGAKLLDFAGTWWAESQNKVQTYENCKGLLIYPGRNEFGVHAMVWPAGLGEFGRVLVVDGVLLMCHRRTFEKLNGFDAQTYKGFHFYDVDTTFRAHLLGLKNYAAPLPLLHTSLGDYGEGWEANRQIFVQKFQASLPCSLSDQHVRPVG